MKDEYWIFGGLALFYLGRFLYRYYQKWLYDKAGREIAGFRYERYLELRDEIFVLKPEDVGITVSDDNETAFALILEIHIYEALLAVVAFSDGMVWAFNTQSARKNISDSNIVSLRLAAIEAVATAQYHFARMRRRNADELLPGHIKFHILTNQDIYSAGDTIKAMLDESSEWTEIITKAFTVVKEFDNAAKNKPFKRIVYPKTIIKRSKPANF